METKVELYIKKLISLCLIFFGTLYALMHFRLEIVLPISLLILSFIISRITNKKPPYLFGMQKVDAFINKKGGFWTLFKIVLSLFGFLYDIIIWEVWSVYVIFEVILDIISLIKEIIYWIVHAIIWFLKLYVPPIIFLFKMIIHYLVKWIWWIYYATFKNVTPSVKLNYYLVSLWGAIIGIFCVLFFYYIAVLTGIPALIIIGVILALLPLAWSFGEIASINENNLQSEPYYEVTSNFENGFESVKYMLYYVVSFFILLLVQLLLNFFGWAPSSGLTFLGITLPINTAISLAMILLFILISFANFIIPTHLLKTEEQETPFHDILSYFKQILNKGLRIILSFIPAGFFSGILMIIPAIIVGLAIALTINLKDIVIEHRINVLENHKEQGMDNVSIYKIDKKIDRLYYYLDFPYSIVSDNLNRGLMEGSIEDLQKGINNQYADITKIELEADARIDKLREDKANLEKEKAGTVRDAKLKMFDIQINQIISETAQTVKIAKEKIDKYNLDIKYLKSKKRNLPVSFFFVIIWASIFGGLVLAVGIAYLGNVYNNMYTLREDEKPTFYRNLVNNIIAKDKKQPLLGFTLLAITVFVVLCVLQNFKIISLF